MRNIEECILQADIPAMRQAMKSGRITLEQLVQAYLRRIERFK